MSRKPETTSPRVAADVAWALANWPRIVRALKAGLGSALTQAPDKKAAKKKGVR